MLFVLLICFAVRTSIQYSDTAEEVFAVSDDGSDTAIVFPGGEQINAINEIIEDLVNSPELISSPSTTNKSVSFERITGNMLYRI